MLAQEFSMLFTNAELPSIINPNSMRDNHGIELNRREVKS